MSAHSSNAIQPAKVKSGTMQRMRTIKGGRCVGDGGVEGDQSQDVVGKKAGGVAYRPEFLLDCVLLSDNLREPSLLRDSVVRWVNAEIKT